MRRYQEERARQKKLFVLRRRRLRDFSNPFDVTFEAFTMTYRFSQDLFFSLVNLIRPHYPITVSELAIPLELKVLSALHFYASGQYQVGTGMSFDASCARSVVSEHIDLLTNALNHPAVLSRIIRFPRTPEEVRISIERNSQLGGRLPWVLAYTDGGLLKCMKPSIENNRRAYIGRKNFACLNIQYTVDRRLYIMNVLARFPGATTDAFIFRSSALREKMIELYPQQRCHLLGDSGYACEPWMLVPFADVPGEDSPEERYNRDHCFDRNAVERAIGVQREAFRAINNERVLHYNPVKCCRMAVAVAVLHNLKVLARLPHYVDVDNCRNLFVHGDEAGEEDEPEPRIYQAGLAARREVVEFLEQHRPQ